MRNNQQKIPACGASEKRNKEFEKVFDLQKYYEHLVTEKAPTIVDVGAHKGESVFFYKKIFPQAKMFCFEPNEENFHLLRQNIANYSDCKAYNIGLSDEEGNVSFFLNKLSHLGSLKKVNTSSKDSLGFAADAPNDVHEITVSTLDLFFQRESLQKINILKIDVQGAELEVIKGAIESIKNTDLIVIEINLFDFYEKDKHKLSTLLRVLEESDFELFDILNLSKNPMNFRTDWVEAVFKKINV